MISALILISGFALANRIWGGLLPKFGREVAILHVAATTFAALYLQGLSAYSALHFGIAIALLYWFGRAWGLDIYFCCFNPTLLKQVDLDNNKGAKWINKICNAIVPNVMIQSDLKKRYWGFVGMSLRGTYFIPMIAVLTLLNTKALLLTPLCLLMGLAYAAQYYQPQSWWYKQYQLPAAELLWGGILGGIIALCL